MVFCSPSDSVNGDVPVEEMQEVDIAGGDDDVAGNEEKGRI